MFKTIILAAVLALACAAPAPQPQPGVVASYSGVVAPVAAAYHVPAVSTYAAAPVVSSYGVHPYAYGGYSGYGAYPAVYY